MQAIFFILGHTLCSTLANICFKYSSASDTVVLFVLWQAFGNVAAFVGSISYSLALRHLPLHVAFPIVQGLAVTSVTVFGAFLVFQEVIRPSQWLGISMIAGGIVLMSYRVKAPTAVDETRQVT